MPGEVFATNEQDGLHYFRVVLRDDQMERLEAIEEKLDELLDLARSQGLTSSRPDWEPADEWEAM
jgi:hypothetical protein